MTLIVSIVCPSVGIPLSFNKLSPNDWAFLTSWALSAEKIVHSFSQKVFSFFGACSALVGSDIVVATVRCCILLRLGVEVAAECEIGAHIRLWRAGCRIEVEHE